MSGPKIDYAELERRRQAELERQRQERLRKIREETEKLNAEISATKTQIDHINMHLSSVSKNVAEAIGMESVMKELHELKTSCKSKLTKALGINVPTEPEAISACARELSKITKNVVAEFFNKVKTIENSIADCSKQLETQSKIAAMSEKFSAGIETMQDIEDFDFTVKKNIITHSDIEQNVKEQAQQILSEIEELINSESIQESDMKDLSAIACNIYKTAFETENSFEAAAIEYKVTKPKITRNIAIFDDMYLDYYAEYVTYLELLNSHATTPIKIVPKRKYRFGSIDELQSEMTQLAENSKAASEKKYIREQIGDVMRLFGYDVPSEIVFDAKHTGSHYICENKSGQSAIHVYLSDKKQMMMEIVGFGKGTASTIIQSSDLKEHERNALLEEQVSFCKLHPKIVEELKKRGVVLSMKSRKEPDVKYCSKIIRLSENDNAVMSDLINEEYEYNEKATKKGRSGKRKEQLMALK